MHDSLGSPFSPDARGASRFRPALLASLIVHAVLGAWFPQERFPARARVATPGSLVVRLEPRVPEIPRALMLPPVLAPDEPERHAPHADPMAARGAAHALTHAPADVLPRREIPALAAIPDPQIYGARDLDTYPQPIEPLDWSRFARSGAGGIAELKIELVIDENGFVGDVERAGPRVDGFPDHELRALLAATRFVPARKDGRAVKSRVVLQVSLGRVKREP